MTLSDLISLIGILIAVIAFMNEKERNFVINKFSIIDKLLIVTTFFIINILLFYNWWRIIFPFFKKLEFIDFPSPNTWVYFILILFICWLFYKIYYSNFPKKNKKRVLNFYNQLLQKEEYHFLFIIISKYEKKELLFNNNNSKYYNHLIKIIFSNTSFLQKTSSYNYQLFNKILINNKTIETHFIYNYIESQLLNPNSFVYSHTDDKNEIKDFCKLVNLSPNKECIFTYIAKNDLISLKKLLNFILFLSLNNNSVSYLYRAILKEIIIRKNAYEIEYLFDEFLKHLEHKNPYNTETFRSISATIIEFSNILENDLFFENYVKKYIKISLKITSSNIIEAKPIFIDLFKNNNSRNSKILITKVHEIYLKMTNSQTKEFNDIINEVLN